MLQFQYLFVLTQMSWHFKDQTMYEYLYNSVLILGFDQTTNFSLLQIESIYRQTTIQMLLKTENCLNALERVENIVRKG